MAAFADGRGLGLIVELFIKSSVVLAAAILCSWLLRRRSASLRHFLLSLFLVGLALLPAFSVLSPGWPAPWLPDWAAVKSVPHAASGAAAGASRGLTGIRPEPGINAALLDLQAADQGAAHQSGGAIRLRTVLGPVFSIIWLAGLAAILARLAAGLFGVRRITREGEALDDSVWERLLHRFIAAVRLNRTVELKAHPQVIIPLTWGFRRPVVIMPSGAGAWTEDGRSSALFHELSHVKRGDFLVMLLVRLSLAVFWFNPLFWVAYKMLKNEQEKACDELVLKAGIRPSTYADNLLSFIRSVRLTRSPLAVFPGVLGMFGRSQLRERLLVILGQKMAFKEVGMKTKVAISALAFLAVAFIGLARPQGASATPGADLVVTDAVVTATVASAQETQQVTEKQKKEDPKPAEPQEQEKKFKKAVRVVVEGEEAGKVPIEITVIEGGTKKALKLDGSVLILKKGEDGKTVLLSPEGKEIAVIGGEEGTRLEIKSGRMIFLGDEKEPHAYKEPKVFTVIEGDEKTSWVLDGDKKLWIYKSKPRLAVVKEMEEPEHITIKRVGKGDGGFTLTKRYVVKEPSVGIDIDAEALEKKIAETQAVLKKLEEQKLAESDLKAQQEALRELEVSLKALEEELKKKEESLKALKVVVEPKVHITHEHGEAPEVEVEEITPDEESRENIVKITRGKEVSAIMLNMKLKGNPKETYEKAVAKLKQDLPQGYALEPKFIEESGMMIIKISGPKGNEEDWEKVQKLVKELHEELKE